MTKLRLPPLTPSLPPLTLRPETIAAQALHGLDAADRRGGAADPPGDDVRPRCRVRADRWPRLRRIAIAARRRRTRERVIAALEGGAAAMVYASGMAAACSAIRAHLAPGAHVVAPRACYFAVRSWLAAFAARWGVHVDFVDTSDTAAVAAALRPGVTRLVWVEAIANPTLEVARHRGARAARARGRARGCASMRPWRPRCTCARSPSARTSSCTARRSTSAATAICSPARSCAHAKTRCGTELAADAPRGGPVPRRRRGVSPAARHADAVRARAAAERHGARSSRRGTRRAAGRHRALSRAAPRIRSTRSRRGG